MTYEKPDLFVTNSILWSFISYKLPHKILSVPQPQRFAYVLN